MGTYPCNKFYVPVPVMMPYRTRHPIGRGTGIRPISAFPLMQELPTSLRLQVHRPTLGEAGTFLNPYRLCWPARELIQNSSPAKVLPPLACDVGYSTAPESPTHLVDNGGRPLRGLTTSTPSVPVFGPYWSYPSQNQSASQWGACTPRPGSGQLGHVGSLLPKCLRVFPDPSKPFYRHSNTHTAPSSDIYSSTPLHNHTS